MKAVIKLIERIGEKPRYSVFYRQPDNEDNLVFVDCFPFKRECRDDTYFNPKRAYDDAMELAQRIEADVSNTEIIIYETDLKN